jgi:hypothetical protein
MAGKKGGVGRHFEGWEAGLVAVVIALAGVLLAVPIRVAPRDLPLPIVDGTALSATIERERAMAAAIVPALESELSHPSGGTALYDLRAFGEAFRAYGRAESSDDVYAVVRARQKLAESLARARALGDDKMVGFRAFQERLFLEELERWESSKATSRELTELGGKFPATAAREGWLEGGALAMTSTLRGILFKRRWNELTGLAETAPFALSLDEQRAFYAFLLEHPFVEGKENLGAADACRLADQWRLRKIEELARLDLTYPFELARGVLYYRLGRYPAAAQAFRDHLGSTDGRFALRARNYLLAALARANEER